MPIGRLSRKTLESRDAPNFDADDIHRRLRRYDREPFMDVLAVFLEAHPDPTTVKEWAKKNPHLWSQALKTLAGVAGFTEKREVQHHHHVQVDQMSDSQIEDQLREMQAKLFSPDNDLIAPAVESPNSLERRDADRAAAAREVEDAEFTELKGSTDAT